MKKLIILALALVIPLLSGADSERNLVVSLAKTVTEKAKQKQIIKQSDRIIIIIDFTQPNYQKRLYVVDTYTNNILFKTYATHGVNSGKSYPDEFSNIINSKQSSIGVYKTAERYYGKNGLSIKLKGLEYTNSNAYKRYIVIHGANYSGKHDGFSWGCPAVPHSDKAKLYSYIKEGTLLVIYYPDSNWLKRSIFLN